MRYTGTTHEISYAATLEFFEARGRAATPDAPQTATMYQDRTLSEQRDVWERETVLPLLELTGAERVLDIGCGYGRWAEVLAGRVGEYVGVDFSAELLKLGTAKGLPRTRFACLAAPEVQPESFAPGTEFELFICSGILIYLNDADVARLAAGIARLAAPRAQVYLREPMAITGDRLTLDRFPSTELQTEYSAIYRTPAQCHEIFGTALRAGGFACTTERTLYPAQLCNRRETEQQIQLWSKKS